MKKTPLIIISAPSGAGKTTFCEKVIQEYEKFEDVITYTTRPMREGEVEGSPYHFVSLEKFESLLKQGFFVESAKVHNRYYGTPKHIFDESWSQGKYLILDVDVQGAETFRKVYPEATYVFIHPPSIDELRNRLVNRDGESEELELRLDNAKRELNEASKFDYEIINDDFDKAYKELQKIIEKCLNLQ